MGKTRYQLLKSTATPLLMLSVVSLGFLFSRILATDTSRYSFLWWNLALAWIPFVAAFYLKHLLQSYSWLSWRPALVSIIWLAFLPNSFYVLTDLIHIHNTGEVSVLFDVAMMSLFAFTGILLGFVALLLVQKELQERFSAGVVYTVMGLILLGSSFAIYLGRYLRWNSWDLILHPIGVLIDVTDRIISPSQYPITVTTTLMFFILTSTVYLALQQLVKALRDVMK